MLTKCKHCEKLNYIFNSDLEEIGFAQNKLLQQEFLYSYKCWSCKMNNIIQTKYLSLNEEDIEINKKIFSLKNIELKKIENSKIIELEDVKHFFNEDNIFIVLNPLAKEIVPIRVEQNIRAKGIYIAIFKNDENKKYERLNLFGVKNNASSPL